LNLDVLLAVLSTAMPSSINILTKAVGTLISSQGFVSVAPFFNVVGIKKNNFIKKKNKKR